MITLDDYLAPDGIDVCRLAILLAMTPDQKSEREMIARLNAIHLKAAATTVSGYGISMKSDTVRNVINLCINTRIIERKRSHVHPVCHCILETAQSTRASDAIGQNYIFKAAVVRREEEFSLCLYGNLAMHELTSHKSIGVGYQILGL